MADVADRRELRQFRQTPEQRFTQEQEHLQPLPDTDFDDTSYFLISVMSPGMAISRLAETVTACRKACVASRYQYGSRWMMNCGSTVMSSRWHPHRLCSAASGWQTVPEHHAPALAAGQSGGTRNLIYSTKRTKSSLEDIQAWYTIAASP